MVIQIYSITSIADAVATAEAGADLIGVVIAEAGVVPEGVGADLARDILAGARPRARGVAMSLLDDRDDICAMVDAVRPDVIHIARPRRLRMDSRAHRACKAAARDTSASGRDVY